MKLVFAKFFSKAYLIDIDPIALHPSDKAFLIGGAVLIMLGIIFRLTSMMAPHQLAKIFWRRLSNWGLTIGLLTALWFGFRYQNTTYLGSHLVVLIILLIGLIWLVRLLRYWLGQYRRDVTQWEKDQLKQKYLRR